MKILIVGDVHWSSYSSILRKQGTKYTKRLENLIKSVNWAEQTAVDHDCKEIVYLGDFFDKAQLTDIELTALQEINWAEMPHHVIVGNHESSVNGLRYSSTKALESNGWIDIIDNVTTKNYSKDTVAVFLPYVIEDDRKPINETIFPLADEQTLENMKTIVFSHNDLKNFRMGKFLSTIGYDISEIENRCNLFINGHLHNGGFVNKKETILNLGNLTGQNFSEDASKYDHLVAVLDTDTLEMEFFENPHALNFMNVDVSSNEDIDNFKLIKNNMVLSIRCREDLVELLREKLKTFSEELLLEYRIVSYRESVSAEDAEDICTLTNVDYLEKFQDFIYNNIDRSEITISEVTEVIK